MSARDAESGDAGGSEAAAPSADVSGDAALGGAGGDGAGAAAAAATAGAGSHDVAAVGGGGPRVRVYPGARAKRVWFVRHCQATSNAAAKGPLGHDAYSSWDYVDAPLTEEGRADAARLRDRVAADPPPYELLVVSPLTRALETATIAFPEARRVVAVEDCRERIGHHPCDKRSKVSEVSTAHARVDFSACAEEDPVWTPERETHAELIARGLRFLEWLRARPERNIVVVTHSSFLQHMLGKSGACVDPEGVGRWFENGEMRETIVV